MDMKNKKLPLITKKMTTLTILFYLLSFTHLSFAGIVLDKIAAIVNDDIIMLSAVNERSDMLKTQEGYSSLTEKQRHKEVLNLLITEKLQLQKAKQLGIIINDEILNKTMQRLATQNQLSMEQFREALNHEGINYARFRETIRQRIIISQLKKRQDRNSSTISEQEINDLMTNQSLLLSKDKEYKFQHILFPAKKNSRLQELNSLKVHANDTRQKIIKGANILSFPNAKDTANWIPSKQLTPSLLRAISPLEIGQTSDVFHDSAGFHLIKLVDKRGGKKEAMLEEVNIRHILLKPTTALNDKATQEKITEIRHKITAGADFSALAKQYSDDGSASNGGELGWSTLDQYVPQFSAMAKKTAINSISPPFKTQFGWHILQVIGKRQSKQTATNLRNQAKKLISTNKPDEAYTNWIKQLRNNAFIEYRVTY